jgi:glycosyltransferase involved in cell wall biosynthesis
VSANGHNGSAPPLRIAHLTATFPPYPGGAGNTCFHFARAQAERGHHVEVFTAPADGEAPEAGGAVVHRIPPVFAIGNAPLIPRIARLHDFDVLHLHYPFMFGAELTMAARARPAGRDQALLVHYKNRIVGRGHRRAIFETYEHTVAPLLIRSADRICVLSRDHAESVPYLRSALERTPERLREMPNGVDTEVFAPGDDDAGLRERLGIPAGAVVAAFVATLDRAHHFKRLDVAIEALARAEHPVHLVVAGDGELLEGYRAAARDAGVGERVHFLGRLPQAKLPEVLRASDLMLLTTEPPESFGIVLIEAMACGLPAVVTEYPGVRAVIDEGETGLLAPRGDAGAVAAALDRMVAMGPEARARMGAAGREKAERSWGWPSLTDRMDEVYSEAIAARRGARS